VASRHGDLSVTMLGLLMLGAAATASANPRIVGNSRDGRCHDALQLADAAFRSTSGSLLWPIAIPARRTTKIVLRQNARDISGGNAIDVDPSGFATLSRVFAKDQEDTIFWAKGLSSGSRLVVVDEPFNWRGDWYYVYLIAPDMTPERFAKERVSENSTLKPLLGDNRWNPPVALQVARSHDYWLIDRGEPYEVMADWTVYLPAKNGMITPCRISFSYSPREGVSGKLPAVRKLAAALDEVLGPGTGEGTLHQTAAIRDEVAREWANASLRPWALTDPPYNSRAEVERGLAEWAKGNTARAALQRRIMAIYPAAERELARYYAVRFKRTDTSAQGLSRNVLDHMFRSYFVFSKRQP
jgi:hypothetical protein